MAQNSYMTVWLQKTYNEEKLEFYILIERSILHNSEKPY